MISPLKLLRLFKAPWRYWK